MGPYTLALTEDMRKELRQLVAIAHYEPVFEEWSHNEISTVARVNPFTSRRPIDFDAGVFVALILIGLSVFAPEGETMNHPPSLHLFVHSHI